MMGFHSSPRMLNLALQMLTLLVVLLVVMLLTIVSVDRHARAEPDLSGVYLLNVERGQTVKTPVSAAQDGAAGLAEIRPVHERDGDSRWLAMMDEQRAISACRADAMLSR